MYCIFKLVISEFKIYFQFEFFKLMTTNLPITWSRICILKAKSMEIIILNSKLFKNNQEILLLYEGLLFWTIIVWGEESVFSTLFKYSSLSFFLLYGSISIILWCKTDLSNNLHFANTLSLFLSLFVFILFSLIFTHFLLFREKVEYLINNQRHRNFERRNLGKLEQLR